MKGKLLLMMNVIEGVHKKFGYPYKKYIDVQATEEVDNGKPQYRTASKKWEINEQPTLYRITYPNKLNRNEARNRLVLISCQDKSYNILCYYCIPLQVVSLSFISGRAHPHPCAPSPPPDNPGLGRGVDFS